MILSDADKATFVHWLDFEISHDEMFVREFRSLGLPEAFVEKLKSEAAACALVRRILTSGETMRIEGKHTGGESP